MIISNVDSSENTEAEYCDIPPLLPAKKGSIVQEESSEPPPPLPAKKGAGTVNKVAENDSSVAGGMKFDLKSLGKDQLWSFMQFEHVYTKQVKIKCFSTVSETSPSDTGIMFPTGSNSASDSSNSLLLLKPPPGTELPRSASVGSAVPRPRPQVGI